MATLSFERITSIFKKATCSQVKVSMFWNMVQFRRWWYRTVILILLVRFYPWPSIVVQSAFNCPNDVHFCWGISSLGAECKPTPLPEPFSVFEWPLAETLQRRRRQTAQPPMQLINFESACFVFPFTSSLKTSWLWHHAASLSSTFKIRSH